ncbi:hypothetical protein [Qaidamihabitans albus]|uniref:hypothetical protein n=1 Tax=Qaidamihabitans albus TaxID=2795733 RepID=UPI0018F245BB|nr:hypothetical protein [Qaidamihabitans albus]
MNEVQLAALRDTDRFGLLAYLTALRERRGPHQDFWATVLADVAETYANEKRTLLDMEHDLLEVRDDV